MGPGGAGASTVLKLAFQRFISGSWNEDAALTVESLSANRGRFTFDLGAGANAIFEEFSGRSQLALGTGITQANLTTLYIQNSSGDQFRIDATTPNARWYRGMDGASGNAYEKVWQSGGGGFLPTMIADTATGYVGIFPGSGNEGATPLKPLHVFGDEALISGTNPGLGFRDGSFNAFKAITTWGNPASGVKVAYTSPSQGILSAGPTALSKLILQVDPDSMFIGADKDVHFYTNAVGAILHAASFENTAGNFIPAGSKNRDAGMVARQWRNIWADRGVFSNADVDPGTKLGASTLRNAILAWVEIEVTAPNTVTLHGAYNVSSVTLSTNRFTINLHQNVTSPGAHGIAQGGSTLTGDGNDSLPFLTQVMRKANNQFYVDCYDSPAHAGGAADLGGFNGYTPGDGAIVLFMVVGLPQSLPS
jgi:hypothetical protein